MKNAKCNATCYKYSIRYPILKILESTLFKLNLYQID